LGEQRASPDSSSMPCSSFFTAHLALRFNLIEPESCLDGTHLYSVRPHIQQCHTVMFFTFTNPPWTTNCSSHMAFPQRSQFISALLNVQ
jgi:hypothetical protein